MTHEQLLETMRMREILPPTAQNTYEALDGVILRNFDYGENELVNDNRIPERDNPVGDLEDWNGNSTYWRSGVFDQTSIDRYGLDADYSEPRPSFWQRVKDHVVPKILDDRRNQARPEVVADTTRGVSEVQQVLRQRYSDYLAGGRVRDTEGVEDHTLDNNFSQDNYGCNLNELTFERVYNSEVGRRIIGLRNEEAARIVDDMEYKRSKDAVTNLIAEHYSDRAQDASIDDKVSEIKDARNSANTWNDFTDYVRDGWNGIAGGTLKKVGLIGGVGAYLGMAGLGPMGWLAATGAAAVGAGPVGAALGGAVLAYGAATLLKPVGEELGTLVGKEFSRNGYRRGAKVAARVASIVPLALGMGAFMSGGFGASLVAGALTVEAGADYMKELSADKIIEHKHARQNIDTLVEGQSRYDNHRRKGKTWYITKEVSKTIGNIAVPFAIAVGAYGLLKSGVHTDPRLIDGNGGGSDGDGNGGAGGAGDDGCDDCGDSGPVVDADVLKESMFKESFYHHCTLGFDESHETALEIDNDFSGGHIDSYVGDGHLISNGTQYNAGDSNDAFAKTFIKVDYFEDGASDPLKPSEVRVFEVDDCGNFDFGDYGEFMKENSDNIQITWEKMLGHNDTNGNGIVDGDETAKVGALASWTGDDVPLFTECYVKANSMTDCGPCATTQDTTPVVPPQQTPPQTTPPVYTAPPTVAPPVTGMMNIAPDSLDLTFGSTVINHGSLFDVNVSAHDVNGNISRFAVDLNGDGVFEYDSNNYGGLSSTGQLSTSFQMSSANMTLGEYHPQLRVFDAGNLHTTITGQHFNVVDGGVVQPVQPTIPTQPGVPDYQPQGPMGSSDELEVHYILKQAGGPRMDLMYDDFMNPNMMQIKQGQQLRIEIDNIPDGFIAQTNLHHMDLYHDFNSNMITPMLGEEAGLVEPGRNTIGTPRYDPVTFARINHDGSGNGVMFQSTPCYCTIEDADGNSVHDDHVLRQVEVRFNDTGNEVWDGANVVSLGNGNLAKDVPDLYSLVTYLYEDLNHNGQVDAGETATVEAISPVFIGDNAELARATGFGIGAGVGFGTGFAFGTLVDLPVPPIPDCPPGEIIPPVDPVDPSGAGVWVPGVNGPTH